MNSQETTITSIPKKSLKHISDQAQVAFSKINKNSYLDIDDLINVGMEIYFIALKKWDSTKSKFDTFLINCLKNEYYKIVRDSFAQIRGGLGTQYNNGKTSTIKIINNISIDSFARLSDADGIFMNIQLAASKNIDLDYNILCGQLKKNLPKKIQRQFVQMVNPDQELLDKAYEKYKFANKCNIDDHMLSEYLSISLQEVKKNKEEIKSIMRKIFRV